MGVAGTTVREVVFLITLGAERRAPTLGRKSRSFPVYARLVEKGTATGRSYFRPHRRAAPMLLAARFGVQRKGDAMQAATDVSFKVGDKAVYPAQGVAEVIRIEEKDIAGSRQKFYVLRILDTDRKILVPVANAGAVGLRQVISEQEIREIFDILRERTIAFDNQTWNRRYRGFMDKIKTGSIYDVAEVLRDLYRLKTDKQLSFGERRMLDTARSLIVKEIAIARNQTEDQVKTEIEAIFVAN
jgi:CarD family transcriptional regulator